MALFAMTTADVKKYVSNLDPAKTKKDVPIDPADLGKGTRVEDVIDWDSATVFHLRPLDVFLMGHIYDNAAVMSGQPGGDAFDLRTMVNRSNLEAVRYGLVAFDNFKDDKGGLKHFKSAKKVVNGREYVVADDATIQLLGIQLAAELAQEIKQLSEVSRAEEKNSEQA